MEKLNHQFWINVFDSIDLEKSESVIEPVNALTFIKNTKSDIPFDFSDDEIRSIYKYLESDYIVLKDFYQKKQGITELNNLDKQELQGLIHWLIKTLHDWKATDDKFYKELSLCCYIASIINENIWKYIDGHFITEELEKAVIGSVVSFYSTFNVSEQNVPIWESEKVDDFQNSVNQKNWILLADNFPTFRRSYFYENTFSFFQEQIFLFGLQFSIGKLNFALNNYDDFFSMMNWCLKCNFSFEDRFKLALESNNWLWKFALLFSLELRKNITFSTKESELLAQVFENISSHEAIKKDWFVIFNRYLVRYYFFAPVFGIYLANHASEEDMDIYLLSLGSDKLYCNSREHSDDRNIVTEVFTTFDKIASEDKKTIFWKKCYQRYIQYDFGSNNADFFMSSVCYSIFDYAVVSYLIECIDEHRRNEIHEIALTQLKDFDMEWSASETQYLSNFYKYLSILQPIYHSGFVIENSEAKSQVIKKFYLPEYLVNDKRQQMMLRLQ